MKSVLETEGLEAIGGFPFPVFASRGTEDRGGAVGTRVSRAYAWLSEVLEFWPRVQVLALAATDWDRLAEMPVFGFPHFIGDDTIVVGSTPAPFFAEIADFLRPDLFKATMRRLEEVYGPSQKVDRFAELLAVHELGHLFHVQAGFWRPATWLPELFCNVGLRATSRKWSLRNWTHSKRSRWPPAWSGPSAWWFATSRRWIGPRVSEAR